MLWLFTRVVWNSAHAQTTAVPCYGYSLGLFRIVLMHRLLQFYTVVTHSGCLQLLTDNGSLMLCQSNDSGCFAVQMRVLDVK